MSVYSSAERLAALEGRTLFFVGGPPKSGTTWLQHLLNAHPMVACRGEGHFGSTLVPLLQSALNDYNSKVTFYNRGLFHETKGFPIAGRDDLQEISTTMVRLMLGHIALENPGAIAIGEKTPANIQSFGLLDWFAPNCVLACTVRDPRDGFTSNWFQTLRFNRAYLEREHGGQMVSFARKYGRQWARMVGAGLQARAVAPDRVFILRYADLHLDPVGQLAPIFARLHVPHDVSTVEECVQRASFRSLSGGRQMGQETRDSFFRKGTVGDWKNHLDEATVAVLIEEAGELFSRFGYE